MNQNSSEIMVPAHLNGSAKVATAESLELGSGTIPQMEEEEPMSLWKWPAKRGKLAQVSKFSLQTRTLILLQC